MQIVHQPQINMLQHISSNYFDVQFVLNEAKNMNDIKDVENLNKENIERGYITGFFDAEGTVRLEKSGASLASIVQTYKPVLLYINEKFKTGSIGVHSRESYDSKGIHRKGASFWRANSERMIPFLEYVSIYSIEKRKQIELMLLYLKEVKTAFGLSLTDEQRNTKQNFVSEFERLKKESGNYVPNMPEDVKLGYIAGFFDGEGYVGIQKSKRDSYMLRVQVTNSNISILNLFKDKFGGEIREYSRNKNIDEKHKRIYQWYSNTNENLKFLKLIYIYTKVKKDEIKYAIEFEEWHNDIRVIRTPEHKAKADWYVTTLQELKSRTDNNIPDEYKNYIGYIQTEEDIINSQMTLEKARLIRKYHINNPKSTYIKMSKIFNVHFGTIGRILNNEIWKEDDGYVALNKMRKVPKHSLNEARKIREDYSTGKFSCHDLAKIYDTTPTTICNIVNNKTLKDINYIPPKLGYSGENNSQSKLTRDIVNEIRERCKNDKNLKYSDLADKYGVTEGAISLVMRNERWYDDNYKPIIRHHRMGINATETKESERSKSEFKKKVWIIKKKKEDNMNNTNTINTESITKEITNT